MIPKRKSRDVLKQRHLWLALAAGVALLVHLESLLESSEVPISTQNKSSPFAGPETLSCRVIQEHKLNGTWSDPNEGEIYARQLVSDPTHIVSVHRQSYDPLRWHHIFGQGQYYEYAVHDHFVSILNEAPAHAVVVDVGANIGVYTLLSATLGRQVLSFEINPANLMRLCESLSLNGLKERVTIMQRGVSDVDDVELEVVVPNNPGEAKMEQGSGGVRTKTITLDTLAQRRGWLENKDLEIALLKIDVEGLEPQIIQGARALLRSGKVRNVLTEFRGMERQIAKDALDTLLNGGFTLVYETEGKVSVARSWEILKYLEENPKRDYVDLWFRWVA